MSPNTSSYAERSVGTHSMISVFLMLIGASSIRLGRSAYRLTTAHLSAYASLENSA